MKKLYAYALDGNKTCSHAKSSTAMVIELCFFMKTKKKKKMKKMKTSKWKNKGNTSKWKKICNSV